MTLPAFWVRIAVLVGLDYTMRLWMHVPHRWLSYSLGSVSGALALAWGLWLLMRGYEGVKTAGERRRYLLSLTMLFLACIWAARWYRM